MAKLTREQLVKWSKNLTNGFQFDVQRYAVWGEKQLKKWIPYGAPEAGKHICATLYYQEQRGGGQKPILHLADYTIEPETKMGHSYGLGVFLDASEEIMEKRNYNKLVKLCEFFPDEVILGLAAQNAVGLAKQTIF